ncbi:MAG: GGDEF domain-containing protein [Gallionella sp.]
MTHTITKYLQTKHPRAIFILSVMIIGLVGAVDCLTGNELSFSIFYLIPIIISGWYSNRIYTLIACLISSATWLIVDYWSGHTYSMAWIIWWNASVRLCVFLITFYLVTQLKTYMENESLLARTDSLTGLNNRHAFNEWLAYHIHSARRYHHPLTLGYIDLDGFKQINDTMGHSTGDRALHVVGSVLQSSVRNTDIVGRLGGDEFVLLLPNVDLDGATTIFEKLHQHLLDEMKINSWPIGFSIGVAVFIRQPKNEDEALMLADKLMYKVKNGSKNSIQYQVVAE